MWRHPKYYKELRKRNNSDQVISPRAATAGTGVHPGPGLKQRDSQVVNQVKLSSQSQAASGKREASSAKLRKFQATSSKR
jgi:hypothetical protein